MTANKSHGIETTQPEMMRVKSAVARSNIVSPSSKTKLNKTMFTSQVETVN